MAVLDSDGLHERVRDDRADQLKSYFPQYFRELTGFRTCHSAIGPAFQSMVFARLMFPRQLRERIFRQQASVVHGGFDLPPITNDRPISHQSFDVVGGHNRGQLWWHVDARHRLHAVPGFACGFSRSRPKPPKTLDPEPIREDAAQFAQLVRVGPGLRRSPSHGPRDDDLTAIGHRSDGTSLNPGSPPSATELNRIRVSRRSLISWMALAGSSVTAKFSLMRDGVTDPVRTAVPR